MAVMPRPSPKIALAIFWGMGFIVLGIGLVRWGPIVAEGYNVLIPYLFAGLMFLLGVFALWSCCYQLLLRRVPAASVEFTSSSLTIGKPESITLSQPGPVSLQFIQVRLVCIEQTITMHKRISRGPDGQRESYGKTSEKILYEKTLIEVNSLLVAANETWNKSADFRIPPGTHPSRESNTRDVIWRVELSGKAGLLTSFLHTLEVPVRA